MIPILYLFFDEILELEILPFFSAYLLQGYLAGIFPVCTLFDLAKAYSLLPSGHQVYIPHIFKT